MIDAEKRGVAAIARAAILASTAAMALCACSTMGCGYGDSPLSPKDADWPIIRAGQSLDERIMAADAGLLAYLAKWDGVESYTAAPPTDAERAIISEQYRRLPAKLRSALDGRVVALVLVDSFIGNGIADFLRIDGLKAYPRRFIMFINREILSTTATERLSQREGSMFRPEPAAGAIRLVVRQPDASGAMADAPALWYMLAHEGSHVFDYAMRVTPKVEPGLPDVAGISSDPDEYPLTAGIWNSYSMPEPSADYAARAKQKFWGLAKADLAIADAAALYDELSTRPFASAYGASCWAEDWAELSTWYQNRELGGSFEVQLLDAAGAVVKSWNPYDDATMTRRFAIVEDLLY